MNLKELLQVAKEKELSLLSVIFENVYQITRPSLIEGLLQEMASVLNNLGEEENIDVDNLLLENLRYWHSELFEED